MNGFLHTAFSHTNSLQSALDFFTSAQKYSITNFTVPDFTYLAKLVLDKGINEFEVVVVPGTVKQGERYAEYEPDTDKLYELVLDTFYKKQ